MPLGGFAPLPLPLGGDAQTGLTAEQYCRITADLVAMVRVMPLAIVHVNNPSGTYSVDWYSAQHGSGLAVAPTLSGAGGTIAVTWDYSYEDEYGKTWPMNIRAAKATCDKSTTAYGADVVLSSPVHVQVTTFPSATGIANDCSFTLVVW